MRGNISVPLTPEALEVFKAGLLDGWGPGYAASLAGITLNRAQRYREIYPEFAALWSAHLKSKDCKKYIRYLT